MVPPDCSPSPPDCPPHRTVPPHLLQTHSKPPTQLRRSSDGVKTSDVRGNAVPKRRKPSNITICTQRNMRDDAKHIYIYIYTSANPCIICTERSRTEQSSSELAGFELAEFDQLFLIGASIACMRCIVYRPVDAHRAPARAHRASFQAHSVCPSAQSVCLGA